MKSLAFEELASAGRRSCGIRAVLALGLVLGLSGTAGAKSGQAKQARAWEAYGKLPLSFEVNQGQTDGRAKFLARGRGYSLFLTSTEAVLALRKPSAGRSSKSEMRSSKLVTHHSSLAAAVLRLKLVGANPAPQVAGREELPGKSHYFLGDDPKKWRTNIPTYAQVEYKDIYPGVDLVYYGQQGQLEYDFVLAPGADPAAITLAFDDLTGPTQASSVQIDARGDLVIETGSGEVRFHKPIVYQSTADSELRTPGDPKSKIENRKFIDGRYVLRVSKSKIENPEYEVGFELASYDPRKPLVIDPTLTYSTYLGGSNEDIGYAIAVDSNGSALVTGTTASTNFPTASPFQAVGGGDSDAFVAELNAAGTALVYSTHLGGSGFDKGAGIAVDASGNAYVTGYTSSPNFPTTTGALQTTYGGNGDAFVTKLNPAGSALVYSTYLGGSDPDFGQEVALDASGSAFVTGSTQSANFPTAGPLQSSNGGVSDAFVTKLNAAGSGLVYSTYLGGNAADYGQGIAVDSSGNAYVTGYTYSSNFPTVNPLQAAGGGDSDAFVAKLSAAGSALVYSTYLGGSAFDKGLGIAVDSTGSAYVTGSTASTNFPTTAGAFQTTYGGNGDAFAAKVNAAGAALVYSTYLGGIDADQGSSVAVDSSGDLYLTGYTRANDFPTANPLQAAFGGGTCALSPCADAFATKLNPAGSALAYSTFLGGTDDDYGQGIAVDSSGNAYLTGGAASPNFPTTAAGAFQGAYGGSGTTGDAFIAKISLIDAPAVVLSPLKLTFADQATGTTSASATVTLTNSGSAPLAITGIGASGDFAQTNTCGTALAAGGASCVISVTFTPTATGTRTGAVTITDDAAGSPQTLALTGNGITPAPAVSLSSSRLTFADQTFETASAAQTLTLTNSGSATLSITGIAATGDFAQTNACGASLAVGASCSIDVAFTPTATGSRTGNVTITDNATGSPHQVTLSGNGIAVFSLSSSSASASVARGTDSTTFTISAAAPSGFTASISLACTGGGGITCTFNPTSITPGQTSTLTVGTLSAVTSGSTSFTVTGTSGVQTASLPLAIYFSDFSLSVSPPVATIAAGESATYTLTITPAYGFNGTVSPSCSGTPQATTCSFAPASATLDGTNASTITVTVKTVVRTLAPPAPKSRFPLPPFLWLLAFLMLAGVGLVRRPHSPRYAAPLATMVLFALLSASCTNYYYSPLQGGGPASGTPGGAYTLIITVKSGNLSHSVAVNLGVS